MLFIVRFLLATLSVSSALFLAGCSLAYAQASGHVQMEMAVPERIGPTIEIHVVYQAKGLYQIFGQVGH
jgi:hypothetical protein